jgi:hypothetical protein
MFDKHSAFPAAAAGRRGGGGQLSPFQLCKGCFLIVGCSTCITKV